MKPNDCFMCLAVLVGATVCNGCENRRRDGDDAHSKKEAAATAHGFKENHGVFVSEETRRAIELKLGEPLEKTISRRIEVVAQVYADGKATVLLDSENAAALTIGQRVELTAASDHIATGTLARIDRQLERAMGQVEALVEFTPNESLKSRSAVRAAFPLLGGLGIVVPQSSLLRTGEGTFVFTVNGSHLQRTRVQTGAAEGGWVQITDGLLAGNVIATNGVQELWCIELQATKGGAACCPAPLQK
ncbi:MAG TPA: hypothetical protein VGF13_17220 [Verrucomicrobiae bacterium]|jgi:multidrug efflux pump subunit AcrA (membrane-fusion protein)